MPDATNTTNTLIVCSGNTCRSPMAEAIARKLLGSSAHVQSAGMDADEGLPATNEAVVVMKEMGYDISNHSSRDIENLDLSSFTLIIAMTQAIAMKLKSLGVDPDRIFALDVPDPYYKGIDIYRSTAKKIEVTLMSVLGPAN